jgi:hypothetical protein
VTGADLWLARREAERAWQRHAEDGAAPGARPEVVRSWHRSSRDLGRERDAAPLLDEDRARALWHGSPLRTAVQTLRADLDRITADGDFVAAVTQADGTILWTQGSRWMQERAALVHFVPGGRWDEPSMGTNALALALRTRRAAEVFSAEHFSQAIHDWVCYSAPIMDPRSGRLFGVVDLSTTWDRAQPLGLAAVQLLAANLGLLSPPTSDVPSPPLVLRVLGPPSVELDGRTVVLPPRQLEILTVLSLNPDGLTLERLHTALYDDLRVQPATVKAELSRLRTALGGLVASRPYRLTVPVVADHLQVLDHVAAGRLAAAVTAYAGELLPSSTSPALREHARYVEHALRRAVLAAGDPDLLYALGERLPFDLEIHERTAACLGTHDARRPIVAARMDAAER